MRDPRTRSIGLNVLQNVIVIPRPTIGARRARHRLTKKITRTLATPPEVMSSVSLRLVGVAAHPDGLTNLIPYR
ncbi:MAG: hypothetical protein QF358_02805 [Arenicellales bacterium]|nr:hypothetical protein [Arenicellales bacterium]